MLVLVKGLVLAVNTVQGVGEGLGAGVGAGEGLEHCSGHPQLLSAEH